jgi:hypothetical protein
VLLHTFADLQAIPPKRMWQSLRTMRHRPPGRAARGNRRDTFNGAIEQAEQLFTAAEVTDPAARPILIFYGLSQLGRAIAAVSTKLDNNEYRLSRHGLDHGSLDGAAQHGLANLMVWGHTSGAFPVVAKALGAAAMQQRCRLGEVWALVPDANRFPLPGSGELRSLPLYSELLPAPMEDWARGLLTELPLHLLQNDDEEPVTGYGPELSRLMEASQSDTARIARQRSRLRDWLAQYPSLAGWDFVTAPDGPVGYRLRDGGKSLDLPLRLPKSPVSDEVTILQQRSFSYHSMMAVYPQLGGRKPAHPFMLWWAVLYVLSRLARYEPRDWMRLIDVAHSAEAAAIEYLLDEALLALPEVAYSCIEAAAAAEPHQAR